MDSNRYEFSENAVKDIDEILSYISLKLSNTKAAENLYNKIIDAINNILKFPSFGVQINNYFIENSTIRKISIDNYLLYYKYYEQKKLIIILRIIYFKKNITTYNIR